MENTNKTRRNSADSPLPPPPPCSEWIQCCKAAGEAGNNSALCGDTSSLTLRSSPPPPLLHLQQTDTRSQHSPVRTSAAEHQNTVRHTERVWQYLQTRPKPPRFSAPRTEQSIQHHGQRLAALPPTVAQGNCSWSSMESLKGQKSSTSQRPLAFVWRSETQSLRSTWAVGVK